MEITQPNRPKRNDFSKTTTLKLVKRAGAMCSNPKCKILTFGAVDNENESYDVGEAAHIHAASKNGPRYNKELLKSYVTSLENGIWLCSNCHDMVDTAFESYSAELLRKWKNDHEEEMKKYGGKKILKTNDESLAKLIISKYENTGALYLLEEAENPHFVIDSFIKMRHDLVEWQSEKYSPSIEFKKHLKKMATALQKFCNNPDNDLTKKGNCIFENILNFRKEYGLYIKWIVETYKIEVEASLQSIFLEAEV
ncbi:HNH endonuclease [Paenibacillus turpanensis]|uniref:HNH endonuclease n=1 Tax=Paenibacillus turpanensis TaxID=2689078 RepID=UPI00140A2094|nr:HNH endonuclease [Paenibacillus turpanensis]